MLEIKELKTVLIEMSKQNGKSVSSLNHALVKNECINMTAINNSYLTVDVGNIPDGFLNIDYFKKTGSIQTSISSFNEEGFNPEDYPTDFDIENPKTEGLPPDIFAVGFQQLGKYASTDQLRKCLTGVYFNPIRNELCATNGHVLITKKLETEFSTQFIIAPHSFKILDILAPYIEDAKIIIEEKKDKKYIQIYGDGFTFTSRCLEEPYPDYNKVIPESDPDLSVTLSPETVKHVIAGLNTLLPYTADKGFHKCVFQGDTISTDFNNSRVGVKVYQKIALDNYRDQATYTGNRHDIICFNAKLFIQLLQDIPQDDIITISYGFTNLYATTIQNGKQRLLIMPINFDADPDWLSKPIEYLEVKPMKVVKKKTVKIDKVTEKLVLSLQEKLGKKTLIEKLKSWDELL